MSSIVSKEQQAAEALCTVLKGIAPYDTGNLATNSIRVVEESPGRFFVAIGGELAPYAKYTQEPWTKGKNPNEGWIDRGINLALPLLKQIFSGAITRDEIKAYLKPYRQSLKEKQALKAEERDRKIKEILAA